jgi:hypothetical protein
MKNWMIALGIGLLAVPAQAGTFGLFVWPNHCKQGFNICYRQYNAFSPAAFGHVVIDGFQNSAPQLMEGPVGPIAIQGIPATSAGSSLVGPVVTSPSAASLPAPAPTLPAPSSALPNQLPAR